MIKYIKELNNSLKEIKVTDLNKDEMLLEDGVKKVFNLLKNLNDKKVIVIGNGGSAAIASHVVNDLCKNDNIKALCFSDYSYNTCMANDFGYEHVYERAINMFSESYDILIAISSSGNSLNILNGVNSARKKGCRIITFSGFKCDNKLRHLGDINFYVPKIHYGYVELSHQIILHMLTDMLAKVNNE